MTLDLKDLEAGDTVELRCGGRAVVSSVEPDITKYIVGLEEDTWAYNQNGSWFDCFRSTHPFDIVAIHKKNPNILVEYMGVYSDFFGVSTKSLANVRDGLLDGRKIVKLTFNHDTGEVTAKVVK